MLPTSSRQPYRSKRCDYPHCRDTEKAGLKLNIQKTQNMTSGPITSRQIDEEKVETVTDLFSWAPKSLRTVTAAMRLKDTCSLEANL